MNKLQAGYAVLDITPALGTGLAGYFIPRKADGIRDTLQVVALALRVEDTTAVILSTDLCLIDTAECNLLRQAVCKATGLPMSAVMIHATHTHTSPYVLSADLPVNKNMHGMEANHDFTPEFEYFRLLSSRLADAAKLAIDDLKPAKMGWAVGNAPNIAFVRRFRMKDGKVRTNPGVGNPDILAPIGDVDERVNVLRFDRESDSLVLVNFGDHPDVVGGCKLSGDWPHLLRIRLEKALDNVKCIFVNGAQGDVNHVNVNAKDGDWNDLENDFDDVARGYGHARHMGNVVAGAVMQVFDKVNYVDVDYLAATEQVAQIPSNMPKPEELPEARRIHELHMAGRDDEIPFEGMELTTVVAEAARMLRYEHGPAQFDMSFTALAIGNIALFGIPGEPFTGIGRGIKEAEGWTLVLPMCLTNGSDGYFPMKEAYDEGGYESRSSRFKAGVAERIIQEGKTILSQLKK